LIALLRAARVARVDLAAYLPVSTGDKLTLSLRAPASLALQLGPNVYLAVNAGATIDDFRKPKRTLSTPLGLTAGWSMAVGRHGATVGVSPSVSWPNAIRPGLRDPVRPGPVVVALTVGFGSPF
jgi:hypothetical protein